jgi:DNA (cytosine-5)-methyltransferase 1
VQALNELGYGCDLLMIDALRFVPQSRLRLFVIGRLGAGTDFPLGLETSDCRPDSVTRFIRRHVQLRWDCAELPSLPNAQPQLSTIIERLPSDHPAWWNEERLAYFMQQLSARHQSVAQRMIEGTDLSYATAFRRVRHGRSMAELRADGIAGCLRTPRGGSGRQILFEAGAGERRVRLLTARECARLQGVPDDYRIDVPLNQALFGFGDGVCVPVVEWIARQALLNKEHTPRDR